MTNDDAPNELDAVVEQRRKDQLKAVRLRKRAQAEIAKADKLLRDIKLGEMQRQIEQSRLMELAMNYMAQAAILDNDRAALKLATDAASQWAQHTRAATTKRRNDEVPKLIEAMTNRGEFAKRLLAIEEDD